MSGAHLAIGVALFVMMATTALGRQRDVTFSPVRSSDSRVLDGVDAGCAASDTFRDLVTRLRASDGVVYLERGFCRVRRSCLLHWMAATPTRRYLRVRIHPKLQGHDLIVTIGHELQHALEVLSRPGIRTSREMTWFFLPPLGSTRTVAETAAALKVGDDIRSELRRFSATEAIGARCPPPSVLNHTSLEGGKCHER